MKKIKGFTLIELIIVMAIFGILMAAIMRMFTPIRETYVDSTLYENQRTTQNGIITYITESVRYSTDLGIYNTNGLTTAQAAVDHFADQYCDHYGITNATIIADVKEIIQEKVDVIVIDNTATTYGGKTCYGRLVRRKQDGTTIVSDAYNASSAKARLALGAAYYDNNTYSIGLDVSTLTVDGVLGVTVASTANHGGKELTNTESQKVSTTSDLSTLKLISQNGDVVCRNLTNNADFGIATAGMVDCDTDTSSATYGYSDSSTVKGEKTYIVFVDYDLKQELDKAAY